MYARTAVSPAANCTCTSSTSRGAGPDGLNITKGLAVIVSGAILLVQKPEDIHDFFINFPVFTDETDPKVGTRNHSAQALNDLNAGLKVLQRFQILLFAYVYFSQ